MSAAEQIETMEAFRSAPEEYQEAVTTGILLMGQGPSPNKDWVRSTFGPLHVCWSVQRSFDIIAIEVIRPALS